MKMHASRFAALAGLQRLGAAAMVAVLFVIGVPAQAAGTSPQEKWSRLAGLFERTMAEYAVGGASMALVEDGQIVDRRDHGYADREAGRKVDGDTIFHWASISKTLNAITVLQMRERGRLELNDPLTRYVPELRRIHNPYGAMDAITIAQALSHTAGFQAPTWPYRSGAAWEPFEPTEWEQLVAMMPYQRIERRPGMQYGYSNPSWIYLARIVEQLSGDPWEYYVQKHVFSPLGMSRSYFGLTPPHLLPYRSQRFVVSREKGEFQYRQDSGEFDPGITIPNGGWNSPLADVAAYIGFLTHATGGDPERARIYESVLPRATLEDMWNPRIAISDAPDADRMGLAFFIAGEGEHTVVGHTGGQAGFASFMYFNPRTGRGVVAGFNTAHAAGTFDPARGGYFAPLRQAAVEMLK